ncbi:unnamed protein product, partial [Musa acuminata subsp. burmannicoides]
MVLWTSSSHGSKGRDLLGGEELRHANLPQILQWLPYGAKATSEPPKESFAVEMVRGRLQHSRSWVLRTCSADPAEETTTAGTWPSFKRMTGPCRLESSHRDWCRRLRPNWW